MIIALLDLHKKYFCFFIGVFPSGGNVMGSETAGMALMNPQSALTDSAKLGNFSAMMATVLVPITCVMVIKTVQMGLMKSMCFVVCDTFLLLLSYRLSLGILEVSIPGTSVDADFCIQSADLN